MKKRLILLLSIGLLVMDIYAQQISNVVDYPEVGKKCPPFLLKGLQNFNKENVTLDDFRGKWLVLDCWNNSCSACIDLFPKINAFQQKYNGQMQFVLVGYNGSQYSKEPDDAAVRKKYEVQRIKHHLNLTVAFDSLLFERFGILICPYLIIIDPNGIIRGTTYNLTEQNIVDFLAGKSPRLPKAWRKDENKITYNPNLPLLLNSNGGNDMDFLYRSVLSEFKDYMARDNEYSFVIRNNRLQVLGVDLASLYRFAFTGAARINYGSSMYGKVSPNLLLELKDKTPFDVDLDLRNGLYAYSIIFPASKNNKANVLKMVQRDLDNYFGYKVSLETRGLPAWNLVVITKVKPKDKLPQGTPSYPFETVGNMLANIAGNHSIQGTFYNSTGLNGKVDITLKCNFKDFEDVKRALRENGFDLVKSEKEMQVVVIKDNPDESN